MRRLLAIVEFLFFYIKEVVVSNFRVAYDVLTPENQMRPGIIALDIADMTDAQIWLMANLITMTPGTLGLAVSGDHQKIYIHAMYLDRPPEEVAARLMNDYGKRVKRVLW
jgi:multicomponent Na+:H+ antiporter subunit E